ncbi:spindle assembly abnormal 4 [Arctopsyche grandis]|uniref:spindle assembly abnormal 4 n=1 Tax=Arctopsyche grandis TaxID=121162 RepID=UPI00406DA2A6
MDKDLPSSPEHLLFRLEELKKMKQLNEERLLEQQALQRQNLLNEKSRLLNDLYKNVDISKLIAMEEYDTFMNISQESEYPYTPTPQSGISTNCEKKFNDDKSSNISNKSDIDEVPVTAKFCNFDELLENELKNEPTDTFTNRSRTNCSARTYLKRGEGMYRFGMTKDDIGRTKNKMPWLKKKCKVKIPSVEPIKTDANEPVDVQKPKRKLDFNLSESIHKPNTSSDAIIKTWADVLSQNNEDIDVGTFEHNYMSDTSVIMSPSFAKISHRKEAAEQKLFDLIEKKVESMSPSSANSFFVKFFGKLNPNPTDGSESNVNYDSHTEMCESGDVERNDDSEETSESSDTENTCKSINTCIPTSTPNQENFNKLEIKAAKKYSVPNIVKIVINKDDSQSTPKITVERPNRHLVEESTEDDVTEVETTQLDHHGDAIKQQISKAKMLAIRSKELETEIEIFGRMKQELEKEKEEFLKEKEEFFKERASAETKLNEDKVINEYYLTEEREKLKKQKMLYDRHVREIKGQLSRKDREEISMLSQEVTHLKEQIASRDAKAGAAQARLRNQVKSLEGEIKRSKDECEKLQKENRKLSNSNARTRRLTNINLLANINKSIAQMATDKSDDIEDVFPTKRISAESLDEVRPKQTQINKQKPRALKHQRTKSAPNLSVASRYAKYFSERDEKEQADGYGLNSDTESDTSSDIQSIKPTIDIFKNTHIEDIYNLNKITTETKSCIKKHPSKLESLPSKLKYPTIEKSKTEDRHRLNPDIESDSSSDTNQRTYANPIKTHYNSTTDQIEVDSVKNQDVYKPSMVSETKSCIKNPSKVENPVKSKFKYTTTEKSSPHPSTKNVREDGSVEMTYENGNHKIVSSDGSHTKFTFYNGDVKDVYRDEGTIKYWHKNRNIYHTSYKDGSEIIQFPDGYIERRYPDGSLQAHCSNGTVRWIKPGNYEECRFPDGTLVSINADGEQTLRFPNGQVEVHTSEYKKREFPDGTVRIMYTDGVIETRYSNGRIRIKDKLGNLVMDTIPNS